MASFLSLLFFFLCTAVCSFVPLAAVNSGQESAGVANLTDRERGLLEIADKIYNLRVTDKTLGKLILIYDSILELYISRSLDESYSKVIDEANSNIFYNTADVLSKIVLGQFTKHFTPYNTHTHIELVYELYYDSNPNMEYRKNFYGGMLLTDTFEIHMMCIITNSRSAAVVVYPIKKSPMHPLPVTQYPITSYQIFDLILIEHDGTPSHSEGQDCIDYQYLDMLIYRWDTYSNLNETLYFCQHWNEVDNEWTSDDCKVIVDWDVPSKVSCFCDVRDNPKTVEYIVYSVIQDLEIFNFDRYVYQESEYLPDYYLDEADLMVEAMDAVSDIARDTKNITPHAFRNVLNMHLSAILCPEKEVIANWTEDFFEDLGTILTHLQTSEDGFFGCRDISVSAFVMDMGTYNGDPVVAYALSENHFLLASYYRLSEDIDLNNLFSPKMEYSLMFSPSVLVENARYGVYVYAANRYFYPASWIGHNVSSMRVIDVVLTPYPNLLDTHEQLVHMYLGREEKEYFNVKKYGCARWSNAIRNWTTNDCYPNPVLYRGVCTCSLTASFSESRTRGQYITFEYTVNDFNNFEGETHYDYVDTEFIEASIFSLKELKTRYPYGRYTVYKALELITELLIRTDGTYRHLDASKESIIGDMREIALNNDCQPLQLFNNFGVVCNKKLLSTTNQTVAFSYNKTLRNYDLNEYTLDTHNASVLYNEYVSLAVRVSESVTTQNSRYAFLVYKANIFLKPRPTIDETICVSRVVDVILLPKECDDPVEEFVEIYLAQTEYNSTRLGCAYWSYELGSWTSLGCNVNIVNNHEVCNCSLTPKFYKGSRKGGQYIAFTFTEAYFDEDVYARLGSKTVTNSHAIFVQGSALIHNASQIPVDDDLVSRVLEVYVKILTHSKDEIVYGDGGKQILSDLEVTFSRYCITLKRMYHHSVSIKGAWSVNSANLKSDLFSNAVLGENSTDAISMASDMSIVVIGYIDTHKSKMSSGFFFNRSTSIDAEMENYYADRVTRRNNTVFACYLLEVDVFKSFRMIFITYPINMSPFPNTMTSNPVFNSRQIDIYTDLENDDTKMFVKGVSGGPDETHVDLFFKPTEKTEDHVVLGCALWDQNKWTEDFCVIELHAQERPFCRCDITKRRVARIIVYEYTKMPNYTFLTSLPATTIVYLVGAVFSLFGFAVIALTAFFFDKWREELGNRIMMQLSAASLFYLCLTMFRETHKIYATTNHMDIGLIVFTVLVHYTRLSHYCWGLVMSVLQYKKFSGVVGASTVSHLLLKVSIFAWGAPLVPLVILLTWDQKVHFCGPDKLTHYILYLVPGGVITAISTGFLVAIVCTITNCFGFTAVKDLERHGVDNKEVIKRHLMQTLMMFFLFGIPTLFEMFNDLVSHSIGAEYIGKILDPIQGFVMFLFFIVLDTRASGYWYLKIYGKPRVQPRAIARKKSVKVPVIKKKRMAPRRVLAVAVNEEVNGDENGVQELHEVIVEACDKVNNKDQVDLNEVASVDELVDNAVTGSEDSIETGVDSNDISTTLADDQKTCKYVTEPDDTMSAPES